MNTTAVLAADTGMRTSVGIIAYIIIGGLAGWIASKFMGTNAQMSNPGALRSSVGIENVAAPRPGWVVAGSGA